MNNILKFTAFFLLTCTMACSQNKNEQTNILKSKNKMNSDSLPNLQRRMYAIQLNIPGSFELYVNDIPARIENSGAMHNTSIDINAYLLRSGKYKFKLRVFPQGDEIEVGILPETASRIKVSLNAYERNTEKFPFAKKGSFISLIDFPIPTIIKPVPFIEFEGEFEVELPYDLEGWSKSADLSKIDKKQLEDEVVNFYEKLRIQLNEGMGDEYIANWVKYDNELRYFEYESKENIEEENNSFKEKIAKKVKGNMLPIEYYKIILYGNGRLVRLERLPTIEINNKPVGCN